MSDDTSNNSQVKRGDYKADTSTKFMRLKALDCFEDVLEMIRYGYPRKRIAQFIQEENGEYDDVTQDSLVRTLNRFTKQEFNRYEKSVDKNLSPEEDLPVKTEEQALERQEKQEKLNVLDEYTSLYRLQKERIDRAVKAERTGNGLLMSEIGKEIRIAADILNDIGSYQQDVGIMPRQARQLDVNVTARADIEPSTSSAEKIAESPSRRGRVLQFLDVANKLSDSALKSLDSEEGDIIEAEYEVPEDQP